jgi:hypothetical protein
LEREMPLSRIAGLVALCTIAGAGVVTAQSTGTIVATVTVTNTAVSAANIDVARNLGGAAHGLETARRDTGIATVSVDARPAGEAHGPIDKPAVTIIYW